jgi:hypothetical protein
MPAVCVSAWLGFVCVCVVYSPPDCQLKDRMLHHLHLSPDLTMASWSVPPVFVCDAGIEPQVRLRCAHGGVQGCMVA